MKKTETWIGDDGIEMLTKDEVINRRTAELANAKLNGPQFEDVVRHITLPMSRKSPETVLEAADAQTAAISRIAQVVGEMAEWQVQVERRRAVQSDMMIQEVHSIVNWTRAGVFFIWCFGAAAFFLLWR